MMPMARKRKLQLKKELRQIVGRKVRHLRSTDRGYYGVLEKPFIRSWAYRRGVKGYNKSIFGQKRGELIRVIERRLKGRKRLSILDVGCGSCRFLAELRRIFKDRIELHGITLAMPFSPEKLEQLRKKVEAERKRPLDEEEKRVFEEVKQASMKIRERIKKHGIKVHIGLAETHKYREKYDLIFSTETFVHTINPLQALENTLNHLKRGGEAYINFGVADFLKGNPELKERLERQGINITELARGAYCFRRTSSNEIKLL